MNKTFKIEDLVKTSRKIQCSARFFEKDTYVKIINISNRGYDLEDQFGNRIYETGFDSIY